MQTDSQVETLKNISAQYYRTKIILEITTDRTVRAKNSKVAQ